MYLQTVVVGVQKEGEHLKAIQTKGKFDVIDFETDAFIDATGDGDLSVLSDCPWEIGREGDGLVQPVPLMFVIDGVNIVRLYRTGRETERMVNATQENYINPLDAMLVNPAESWGVIF